MAKELRGISRPKHTDQLPIPSPCSALNPLGSQSETPVLGHDVPDNYSRVQAHLMIPAQTCLQLPQPKQGVSILRDISYQHTACGVVSNGLAGKLSGCTGYVVLHQAKSKSNL